MSERETSPGRLRRALRRSDFLRITRRGSRVSSRYFIVFFDGREPAGGRGAESPEARLGITVTRKVGHAVRRNRIKRLVREWFRSAGPDLGAYDVVVIAKRDIPSDLRLREVGADLDAAVARQVRGTPGGPGSRRPSGRDEARR